MNTTGHGPAPFRFALGVPLLLLALMATATPVCGGSDTGGFWRSGGTARSTPVVSISVNTSQIHEGVVARLIVTSSAASSFLLTPRFQTTPKKASKNDFGMSPASFIIPAGQSSASIDLHATAGTLTEKNESVSTKLAKGPGYKVGPNNKVSVTILNGP